MPDPEKLVKKALIKKLVSAVPELESYTNDIKFTRQGTKLFPDLSSIPQDIMEKIAKAFPESVVRK